MKKIEINRMEKLQGGYSCFFAAPVYIINIFIPFTSTQSSAERLMYCIEH
jgi:hypothetical protein